MNLHVDENGRSGGHIAIEVKNLFRSEAKWRQRGWFRFVELTFWTIVCRKLDRPG
jgi:hypothetical protein